jgi:hypothetical protein
MRRFIPVLVLAILGATVVTGCFVERRGPRRTVVNERRSCPPAYHWEGGDCVHNGHGHGNGNHGKHKGR